MKINIDKETLSKILIENRKRHKEEFNEAWGLYKVDAVEKLTDLLVNAKKAKFEDVISTATYSVRPENHDADYQRILGMLEIAGDGQIELSEQDYTEYVLDDWAWKAQFNATTLSLKAKR